MLLKPMRFIGKRRISYRIIKLSSPTVMVICILIQCVMFGICCSLHVYCPKSHILL
ncbi:hypothetical protein DsansV1_C13g0120761 [Dioscorea sansibarensis]